MFLIIIKGKMRNNLYKLIKDHVRGGVIVTIKDNIIISDKLNLKSCFSDDKVRQVKHIKFNKHFSVVQVSNHGLF